MTPVELLSDSVIRQKIRYWRKPIRRFHPRREPRLRELRAEQLRRAARTIIEAIGEE